MTNKKSKIRKKLMNIRTATIDEQFNENLNYMRKCQADCRHDGDIENNEYWTTKINKLLNMRTLVKASPLLLSLIVIMISIVALLK